jgi:hypothetical protein
MISMIINLFNILITYFFNNWKTALSGVIILVVVGLRLFEFITTEAMSITLATLSGYGFIVSKDASRKDNDI